MGNSGYNAGRAIISSEGSVTCTMDFFEVQGSAKPELCGSAAPKVGRRQFHEGQELAKPEFCGSAALEKKRRQFLAIDACPRGRAVSRSYRLGAAFRDEFMRRLPDTQLTELRLGDLALMPLTGADVRARNEGRVDGASLALARQFAEADVVEICAPYWNFQFPAMLAAYFERICISGVTFTYENDLPVGLCRAQALAYFTSAGSPIGENDWGGGYLRAMTGQLLGVRRFYSAIADGLDTFGADVEAILTRAQAQARDIAAAIAQVFI